MRSRTAMILICLALIIVFLSVYNFPKKVDVSREALSMTDKKEEKVSVKVDGTLYRPIFKEWSFSGKISIESYPYTKNHDMMVLKITQRNKGINGSTLAYLSSESNPDLGADIKFNNDFSVFNILTTTELRDGKVNREADIVSITYPAKNYEEAVQTQKSIEIKLNQ
ncbi:hypothetical protein [Saccharibacillus qingshengii]|uniref:hypothetical protein n=1 Tax=Saccharibacillus qingshengii TaxID=1763540 RepID=UPI001555F7A4|nr:hypothetical protein [Saccharibacillus qingshengii]